MLTSHCLAFGSLCGGKYCKYHSYNTVSEKEGNSYCTLYIEKSEETHEHCYRSRKNDARASTSITLSPEPMMKRP